MKMMKILLIAILLFNSSIVLAVEDKNDGLKLYQEKMNYWLNRSKNAFSCKNRFEVGLFLYDATNEEGVGPSEELAMLIEDKAIKDPQCIIEALLVIPENKKTKVLKHYFTDPLYGKVSDYKLIIEGTRVNKLLHRTP